MSRWSVGMPHAVTGQHSSPGSSQSYRHSIVRHEPSPLSAASRNPASVTATTPEEHTPGHECHCEFTQTAPTLSSSGTKLPACFSVCSCPLDSTSERLQSHEKRRHAIAPPGETLTTRPVSCLRASSRHTTVPEPDFLWSGATEDGAPHAHR